MKTKADAVLNKHHLIDLMVDKATALEQVANQTLANGLTSEKLFGGANEVIIQHRDECYVLRLTKQNKLILTK